MTTTDEPLSHWIAVARLSFENDCNRLFEELGISRAELAERVGASPAYVSKILNGTAGNYQLSTMAKWARALGATVQIRLAKEGKEVVRVVDYETAGALEDLRSQDDQGPSPVLEYSASSLLSRAYELLAEDASESDVESVFEIQAEALRLAEFFADSPLRDSGLDLERLQDLPRDLDL